MLRDTACTHRRLCPIPISGQSGLPNIKKPLCPFSYVWTRKQTIDACIGAHNLPAGSGICALFA
ncbi:hypothetical protein CT19431_MP80232 [Cupriavidus taiwanensis]|nr:hypothetical protein CT19431_MP80232 [Cupriavidus taiwanensis]